MPVTNIGALQMGSSPAGKAATLERILGFEQQIKQAGLGLIVMPEALLGGYPKGEIFVILMIEDTEGVANLDAILKSGFVLLGENAPDEIAIGVIGKFWKLSGGRFCEDAANFAAFDRPGYAKAVWNFSLVDLGANITRLATETRVVCSDSASRVRFRVYWALIGPFSGLIRREVLRAIKREAEIHFQAARL